MRWLLGLLLAGPLRGPVVLDLLEADHLPVVRPHLRPTGLRLDRPVQDRPVEPRQPFGVDNNNDKARCPLAW